MPETLSAIQRTNEGITVDVAVARQRILDFLRAHPGQYFGVHDFSHGKLPSGEVYLYTGREMEPFWWLSQWGEKAPEGFEALSTKDPRTTYAAHTDHVGFVGEPGNTRLGYTKSKVKLSQKTDIALNDKMLDEVYEFLRARPGTAYTAGEIADVLAPRVRKSIWSFRHRPEPTTANGTKRWRITSTLGEMISWRSSSSDKSLWKDMIATLYGSEWMFGIPTVQPKEVA